MQGACPRDGRGAPRALFSGGEDALHGEIARHDAGQHRQQRPANHQTHTGIAFEAGRGPDQHADGAEHDTEGSVQAGGEMTL